MICCKGDGGHTYESVTIFFITFLNGSTYQSEAKDERNDLPEM